MFTATVPQSANAVKPIYATCTAGGMTPRLMFQAEWLLMQGERLTVSFVHGPYFHDCNLVGYAPGNRDLIALVSLDTQRYAEVAMSTVFLSQDLLDRLESMATEADNYAKDLQIAQRHRESGRNAYNGQFTREAHY